MTKTFRKFKQTIIFMKKFLKLESLNINNHSINSINYSAAYNQTLDEILVEN